MSSILPRPTEMTPERAIFVAGKLADDLISSANMPAEDRNEIIQDIVKYARPDMDGYELAKTLDDRRFWNCDLNTAEILDEWSSLYHDEMKVLEADWALINDIKPPFPIGHLILWRGKPGQIKAIYAHGAAKYEISREDGRFIVDFEDVQEP